MIDDLRVVMVTAGITSDIEHGLLDLADGPTVILQGSIAAVKAAAAFFDEPVRIIAALQAAASEVRDE